MDTKSAATTPESDTRAGQSLTNSSDHVKYEDNIETIAREAHEDINPGEPLSASWRKEPLSPDEASKVMQILQACSNQNHERLITLAATPGGFIEDRVRQVAWPLLLGNNDQQTQQSSAAQWRDLPEHRDEGQVKLDVHRAFVYYPKGESELQIEQRKQELSDLITEVLRRHPDLCYFQGYHDISQVLLLVLGAREAAPLMARLTLLRIRDFMLPSISATESHLQLVPAILYAADPALCEHLSGLQPFFALAATLTLFAHDIEEYGGIARLFDFLLAREAVVSLYMYATIIMMRKDELFEMEADEPEMLYAILCKLPKLLDLEDLISQTVTLFNEHPPESLPFHVWENISPYSVLKTTRDSSTLPLQTLEQGELYMRKHSSQIERQQATKRMIARTQFLARKYRKPASAVTLAILVGAVSIWLGRTPVMGSQTVYNGASNRLVALFTYTLNLVRR